MRIYLALSAWSVALLHSALAGETATAVLEPQTQSFTIELNGPVAGVTPLFGPVREAEWAPGWAPRFLRPAHGAQKEGVILTTTSGHGKDRLWVLTVYDAREGRVGYVVVTPGITATEIQIRVVPDREQHCKATITYRRSALRPEGNQEVAQLDAHWAKNQQVHWETAINAALAKERRP